MVIELANRIPIKGGKVEHVVYDATALRMWVSYAAGQAEASTRPCAIQDLPTLGAEIDGVPDLQVWLDKKQQACRGTFSTRPQLAITSFTLGFGLLEGPEAIHHFKRDGGASRILSQAS